MKNKILTSSYLIAISFVLSACTFSDQNSNSDNSNSSNNSESNISSESSLDSESTDSFSSSSSSTNSTESVSSDSIQKENERREFENEIESILASKVNKQLDEEMVKSVNTKYFTVINDYQFGKVLESIGYAILADDSEVDVLLALPLNASQYDELLNLNINNVSKNTDLFDSYSNEQLFYVLNIIKNDELKYSFATKNGEMWNLDVPSATKLEGLIEAKSLGIINDSYINKSGQAYVDSVDFKTSFLDNTKSSLGDCLVLNGFLTTIKNKVVTFELYFNVNEDNYIKLSNALPETADIEKEMAKNYTRNQMAIIYEVVEDETTQALYYKLDGTGEML